MNCRGFTPPEIFEALIRHDTQNPCYSDVIWGDKSPTYINHVALIQSAFPGARFIHIIRDVRDYCMSINKAWGKNMLRAAQRWVDDLTRCNEQSRAFSLHLMTIKYENLLGNAEIELRKICDFLDVQFCNSMLNLPQPTENIGAAKGEKKIITTNQLKYLDKMDNSLLLSVESLTFPVLLQYGYNCNYFNEVNRIPKWKMFLYQLADAVNVTRAGIKDHGISGTFKYSLFYWFIRKYEPWS
jgi:hypothetical protein